MSINWATIRTALLDWAGSTGMTVIWSDQAIPKPPRPYVTLRISPVLTPAMQEIRQGNNIGEFFHCSLKEVSAAVQVIADVTAAGGSEHTLKADQLVDLVSTYTTREIFQAAGMAIIDTSPVIDVTTYLETNYEPKAVFDLRFYVSSNTLEQRTPEQGQGIESVSVNGVTIES